MKSPLKILLCDESLAIRRAVEIALRRFKPELHFCEVDQDFEAQFQRVQPALIILDSQFKDKAILERFAQYALQNSAKIILLCSSLDEKEDFKNFPDSSRLWKPFEARVLSELVAGLFPSSDEKVKTIHPVPPPAPTQIDLKSPVMPPPIPKVEVPVVPPPTPPPVSATAPTIPSIPIPIPNIKNPLKDAPSPQFNDPTQIELGGDEVALELENQMKDFENENTVTQFDLETLEDVEVKGPDRPKVNTLEELWGEKEVQPAVEADASQNLKQNSDNIHSDATLLDLEIKDPFSAPVLIKNKVNDGRVENQVVFDQGRTSDDSLLRDEVSEEKQAAELEKPEAVTQDEVNKNLWDLDFAENSVAATQDTAVDFKEDTLGGFSEEEASAELEGFDSTWAPHSTVHGMKAKQAELKEDVFQSVVPLREQSQVELQDNINFDSPTQVELSTPLEEELLSKDAVEEAVEKEISSLPVNLPKLASRPKPPVHALFEKKEYELEKQKIEKTPIQFEDLDEECVIELKKLVREQVRAELQTSMMNEINERLNQVLKELEE